MDIYRARDVQIRTKLSRAQLYRLERSGNFPARKMLTERLCFWVAAEVEQWLASRLAAKPYGAAAGSTAVNAPNAATAGTNHAGSGGAQ